MNEPNLVAIIMPNKICNLACKYCYVVEKPPERMSLALAERVISELLHYNDPAKPTKIIWHGGEPLLAGLDFLRSICTLIHEQYPNHDVRHGIQTNGILLTDPWIDFFIAENFAVGVSLDGPREMHDACRKTAGGQGSFDQIFRNIMRARDRGLIIGALCVVTRNTLGHEEELFNFFYHNKLDFMFHPLTPMNNAMNDDLGITPEEFAQVSMRLFDLSFFQPEPRVTSVAPTLDYMKAVMMGCASGFCVFAESCAREYISVDPQGNIYVCDRFAGNPEMSFGNIGKQSLVQILDSPVRQEFLKPRAELIPKCQQCKWVRLCNAGCSHEAYVRTGSIFHPDAYCETYQCMFQYAYEVVSKELAKLEKSVTSREHHGS
jgi:uncharacterized protein